MRWWGIISLAIIYADYPFSYERMATGAYNRGTTMVARSMAFGRLDALVERVATMSLPRRGGKG